MSRLSQILIIRFFEIQFIKTQSKTYNIKIFLKRLKTLYFSQIKAPKSQIKEFCLNSKKIVIIKIKIIL